LNLTDALSGRAKLEGIQWLLLSAGPRRVLREQLETLLSAPASLGPCRLRRAKFKPGRKLTAYYDALVHKGGAQGYCARSVAVTWQSDGDADRGREDGDLAAMQAEAIRRGVAAPFRQLTADVPEWRMHVSVWPLDTRFVHLVRLSDARYVRKMLSAVYAESGHAADEPDGYGVTPIRYRPGQRHVLRYDRVGVEKGAVFAKLYRGEDGASVFRVATQAAEWLAHQGKGVTAERPLGYLVGDEVVLYAGLTGAALSARLRPRRKMRMAQCLERAGAALHALHCMPLAVAGPLRSHDFEAEISEIARAGAHIRVLLPSAGAVIDELLSRARKLHERLPQEPPTFTHGDFKSEHVWAGPGGLTLIDFDASHLGDPALDIGKFLAHLDLWHVTYDPAGLEQARASFLAGYIPGAPEERLLRARLYEAVELVKITARRVRLFDSDWTSRTERLIGRAHAAMNALQTALSVPARQLSLSVRTLYNNIRSVR